MADLYGEDVVKGTVYALSDVAKGIKASEIVACDGFKDNGKNVFLVDFSAVNNERFSTMPCFGDTTYVFAYGHDINTSRSTITLLIFMSSTDTCKPGNASQSVSKLFSFYNSKRLSNSGVKQTISLAGKNGFASGYLISMQLRAYNPSLNAVTVTVTFMSSPPSDN